jgi:hypothetical protein
MKTLFIRLTPLIVFLLLPGWAVAAETSIDATTIFRIEKRDITGTGKQNINPATQFIGLDMDKLADGNLSIHAYGWGRIDLGDESYSTGKSDASLTYGYLRYRFSTANADARAGRFFVREGIVNEQVDGVSARTDLPLGFGISAFGGATVHNDNLYGESNDGKGDYLYGGRVRYRYKGAFELGLSGVYEDAAPALLIHANGSRRLFGPDIWLSPHKSIELIGHSSYNTTTGGFAEHSYLLNLKPVQHLVLSGEFTEHKERSFFYSWSMFSGAALNPADKARSVGVGASYEIGKLLELDVDYKHYTREFGSANRYGGTLKLNFMDNSLRTGVGYHFLQADKEFAISGTTAASYQELRGYALLDSKSFFAAVDLLGFFFKEKIYNESSATEAVASLGYHITPELALSGDISYGRNPEFSEETKGLLRLTYNASFGGKGEKK